MSHSESEPDFFNFAINLASDFDSTSESKSKSKSQSRSDSESDFNSILVFVFSLLYIYTLLNKLEDDFFINIHNRINSYASNSSIMHIFFWHIITQNVCFYYTIKFSYFSF